jgi:hypothetical protein
MRLAEKRLADRARVLKVPGVRGVLKVLVPRVLTVQVEQ